LRIFKRVSSQAIAFIFLLSCASCTKRAGGIAVELVGRGRTYLENASTLRINIATEPPSLDWSKSGDTVSSLVLNNIMEGLATYDFNDPEMQPVPALALKWVPSEKSRKWKITLRSGVKWTDGADFTAQNVFDAWKRLLAPETASDIASTLFSIKGAKDFNRGQNKDFAKVGIKIFSPLEISVELEKPMAYFPHLLTHHSTFPIRKDLIDRFGSRWTDPKYIQTLGPFRLAAWQHDNLLVMERSSSYYGEKAKIQYILAYMISEQATAMNLFESGKIDVLDTLPSADLRALRKRADYVQNPVLQTYFYVLNVKKSPFDQPLVRRALSLALDRKQIVQILSGGPEPLSSWVPRGVFGFEENLGLAFDPEKARALLKKAGYANPSLLPKITIFFNTNEDNQRIAENIQAQVKSNLGISVELKNQEWKVYLSSVRTDPPQLFRFGWRADYPDPDNFMNLMISDSDNNHSLWKNQAYDELIAQASSEAKLETRRALYAKAQKILIEDEMPVLPLFASVGQHLIAKRVIGYPLNPLSRYEYRGVQLK
jgi:oligopeptide transport system substrate-binding protein